MPFDEINREFSFPLQKIIDEQKLEVIYMPEDGENTLISDHEINRPGLQFAGFYEYFDKQRIQVLGKTEWAYLNTLEPEVRRSRIDNLLSYKFPALMVTRNLEIFPELLESAKSNEMPLLRTEESTSVFTSKLVNFLNLQLAPRITRHGVLIEIYGEGVLILGESGVGKSETAIELVKRGHRLIADDAVEIKKASNITLVGSSPDNIRHFLELRGIGIIDVKTLFGVESVKDTQSIDLVIKLEEWDRDKEYDRLGLHEEYTEYLGNKFVCHSLPIRPGRNLAIIVEAAAVNHRQKKMGYNAAEALYKRVQANLAKKRENTDDEE